MVEKELRSLVRTPRFRLVFVMGFSFGLVVWLPMMLRGRVTHSAVSGNFMAVVSLYALFLLAQVTYGNAFGFDQFRRATLFSGARGHLARAGRQEHRRRHFHFPGDRGRGRRLLVAAPGNLAGPIGEAFLVTAIAALYLLGIGNLSSVNYAHPMRPQRVSGGGAGGRTQGLLFLLYPLALLPLFLAYLARYAFDNQAIFYTILALAAALGVAVYWLAMESAVSTAHNRRETMLAELSRGEGPMATE